MVDAYSKWIEAVPTATATSTAVIEVCRERFAQFGLPETIVMDNVPASLALNLLPSSRGIELSILQQHPTTGFQRTCQKSCSNS